MMNRYILLAGLLFLVIFSGCRDQWEAHYQQPPETVDMNVWDALQLNSDVSVFVDLLKEHSYDTLFSSDNTYTLFIPDNESLSMFLDSSEATESLIDYHISRHFLQSGNVDANKKIQTSGEKYVMFEKNASVALFDGIPATYESPLYINGKYFILSDVAVPRPNLYEFFAATNPTLRAYIDSKDSIILDREESIPIGFDANGNTIYDTVAIVINEFEEEYFPVSEEFRSKTATIVFPSAVNYQSALDEMAAQLGDLYQDHSDIPLEWQNEILIPYLLEHGVFQNSLEPIEFVPSGLFGDTLKLKNILGDSVVIEYTPGDKSVCSNGYAYNLNEFKVPDTLFSGATRFEGEDLLGIAGINKYDWIEGVIVDGTQAFEPQIVPSQNFSNDSALRVSFSNGFAGEYSVEFNVDNLFPRRYLMVVRTSMTTGGRFRVYFNDEMVKDINSYEFILNPLYYLSVTGELYFPANGFILYDCWINNENPYGDATLKFEYVGPANMPTNGLVFDYIDFIPYDD